MASSSTQSRPKDPSGGRWISSLTIIKNQLLSDADAERYRCVYSKDEGRCPSNCKDFRANNANRFLDALDIFDGRSFPEVSSEDFLVIVRSLFCRTHRPERKFEDVYKAWFRYLWQVETEQNKRNVFEAIREHVNRIRSFQPRTPPKRPELSSTQSDPRDLRSQHLPDGSKTESQIREEQTLTDTPTRSKYLPPSVHLPTESCEPVRFADINSALAGNELSLPHRSVSQPKEIPATGSPHHLGIQLPSTARTSCRVGLSPLNPSVQEGSAAAEKTSSPRLPENVHTREGDPVSAYRSKFEFELKKKNPQSTKFESANPSQHKGSQYRFGLDFSAKRFTFAPTLPQENAPISISETIEGSQGPKSAQHSQPDIFEIEATSPLPDSKRPSSAGPSQQKDFPFDLGSEPIVDWFSSRPLSPPNDISNTDTRQRPDNGSMPIPPLTRHGYRGPHVRSGSEESETSILQGGPQGAPVDTAPSPCSSRFSGASLGTPKGPHKSGKSKSQTSVSIGNVPVDLSAASTSGYQESPFEGDSHFKARKGMPKPDTTGDSPTPKESNASVNETNRPNSTSGSRHDDVPEEERVSSVTPGFAGSNAEEENANEPPTGLFAREIDFAIKGVLLENILADGYVYVLQAPKYFQARGMKNLVKIGNTTDIDVRIKQLKKDCGFEDLRRCRNDITPMPIHLYKRVEKLVHTELANFQRDWKCQKCDRTHTEWFEVDEGVAVEAVERWQRFVIQEPWDQNGTLKGFWGQRLRASTGPFAKGDENTKTAWKNHQLRQERWTAWLEEAVDAQKSIKGPDQD